MNTYILILCGVLALVAVVAIVWAILLGRDVRTARAQYTAVQGSLETTEAELGNAREARRHAEQELAVVKATAEQQIHMLEARNEEQQREAEKRRAEEAARYQKRIEEQQREAEQRRTEEIEHLKSHFKSLSAEILTEQSKQFRETNKESMDVLLKPFRDNITEFRQRVEHIYSHENEQRGELKNELKHLLELNQRITTETTNLTNALRGNSKVQGDWGGTMLETILDSSSLVKGVHYLTQHNLKDAEGNNPRPDVILRLPEEKQIVIDSKVSLTAYVNYTAATDETERRAHLADHVASLRKHIKELGNKIGALYLSTLLRGETAPGTRNANMLLSDKVSRILVGMGLYEIRNFSFISPKLLDKLNLSADDKRLNVLKLINPLGEDTSVMRSTLVPSVLGTVSLNQNRNNEAAMLYEISPVFDMSSYKQGDLPHEQPMLCIGAYGPKVDFYLVRDIVLDMLARFGVTCEIIPGAEPYHHPGRAAKLMVGDVCLANVAEVHPAIMAAFELTKRTVIAEVNLELLGELRCKMGHVHALPKFPAVTRDIALVMDEKTTVGSVLGSIRKAGGALLESAEMFDIYRGAQLGEGKKSVAFSLAFRNSERTLSDDDVNPLMKKILAACEKDNGAVLRL